MLKKYAIYDENFNIIEVIRANKEPSNNSLQINVNEMRPDCLEIVDQDVYGNIIVTDENGNPVLDENDNVQIENVFLGTKKVVQINETAQSAANIVKQANDDVKAMELVRQKRNELLRETDHIMLSDSPIVDKSEYETYRQALRDLPANTPDPHNPTYPNKPE